MFPASRGLSRQDKLKWQERDLCRLPTSFLSRMPSRSLNNQWRFCHVWHNPENWFQFEWEPERLSGCWIWARAQILNGPIRAAVVVDPITSLWEKPKRRILRQIFRSLWAFQLAKHTYLEWNLLGFMNCWFYCDSGLFFFRRKGFVEWCLASNGWSGFPANRGLSRRSKNKRFALARRETHKQIAFFTETKYDFSL